MHFQTAKCITPLYLPAKMVQRHTMATKKYKGTLTKKITKPTSPNKSGISKNLSFLEVTHFQWRLKKTLKIFKLPVLKGIRLPLISEKQNSVTQYIMCLTNKKPRTYYSWIPVNTIESNPVISAEAECLTGKALVQIGKSTQIHQKSTWTFLL